jgi:Ubiquitin-protein ligase
MFKVKIEYQISKVAAKMADRFCRIIQNQMKLATKDPHEFLKFAYASDENVTKWFVMLSGFDGDEGEYKDGEYLVELDIPPGFPRDPPVFRFLTPNGLFEVGVSACVHIGVYHPENYRPAIKLYSFCEQLVSGMIGWKFIGSGIGIINTTVEQKKMLAAQSREYNRMFNREALERINEHYAFYSKKWQTGDKSAAVTAPVPAPAPAPAQVPDQVDTNSQDNINTNANSHAHANNIPAAKSEAASAEVTKPSAAAKPPTTTKRPVMAKPATADLSTNAPSATAKPPAAKKAGAKAPSAEQVAPPAAKKAGAKTAGAKKAGAKIPSAAKKAGAKKTAPEKQQ